jgi:hypothetical protein
MVEAFSVLEFGIVYIQYKEHLEISWLVKEVLLLSELCICLKKQVFIKGSNYIEILCLQFESASHFTAANIQLKMSLLVPNTHTHPSDWATAVSHCDTVSFYD